MPMAYLETTDCDTQG